jgi:hypothetical protein
MNTFTALKTVKKNVVKLVEAEISATGPEAHYFPPQYNTVGNNFPYTFMGLEPGTTKAQVRKCLENWNKGDNGILDRRRPIYDLDTRD